MYKNRIDELKSKFKVAEDKALNLEDDYEQFVLNLEKELYSEIESVQDILFLDSKYGKVLKELNGLLDEINTLKSENEFYDEKAALDMMFPNRYDDDFDEES